MKEFGIITLNTLRACLFISSSARPPSSSTLSPDGCISDAVQTPIQVPQGWEYTSGAYDHPIMYLISNSDDKRRILSGQGQ